MYLILSFGNRTNKDADGAHGQAELPEQDHVDVPEPPPKDPAHRHGARLPLRQQLPRRGGHRAARGDVAVGEPQHRRDAAAAAREAHPGGACLRPPRLRGVSPARGGAQDRLSYSYILLLPLFAFFRELPKIVWFTVTHLAPVFSFFRAALFNMICNQQPTGYILDRCLLCGGGTDVS